MGRNEKLNRVSRVTEELGKQEVIHFRGTREARAELNPAIDIHLAFWLKQNLFLPYCFNLVFYILLDKEHYELYEKAIGKGLNNILIYY